VFGTLQVFEYRYGCVPVFEGGVFDVGGDSTGGMGNVQAGGVRQTAEGSCANPSDDVCDRTQVLDRILCFQAGYGSLNACGVIRNDQEVVYCNCEVNKVLGVLGYPEEVCTRVAGQALVVCECKEC